MRCDDCGRTFGDGDACQACGFQPQPPAGKSQQLDAVNAARELLRAARKRRNLTVVKDEK